MFSCQAIKARKMCFTIFQNETTPFQTIKTRSSNSQTLKFFQQGLVDGFGQKLTISPCFHFWQYSAGKCVLRYSSTKAPFQAMTTRNQKSRKIEIFQNGLTHNFSPKMAIFQIFFLGNIGYEFVFYDILQRNNRFLGYKKKNSKSRKIGIFPKRLTHGFGPKNHNFSTFFLTQYRQGKCLLRYFKTKQRISRLKKKKKFKKSKN